MEPPVDAKVASEFAEQSDESGDHSFSHLLVGFRR
jgi:hypothetical protein